MTVRQRAAIAGGVVAIVAITLWLTVFHNADATDVILASGTVETTEADLGFQTPGRIDSIAADEGDAVTAGQVLAWLDRTELAARVAATRAQEGAARARLLELERGSRSEEVAQGRAHLAAAEHRLAEAERSLERTRRLHEGGAVSREQLDREETATQVLRTQYHTVKEQLALLEQGPRAETIAARRALVRQAAAAVAQAEAALANAVIHAPFDGVVSVRHREPGEVVGGGAPVLTVRNPDDRWVRIYVREDEVGRLALGQPATIAADAYRERSYEGKVVFIADEAEFTPRNVQTTEERVKLVFRVKVRITGDPSGDLKPGLPADVRLVTSGS